jgi:hypothetical protein
MAINHHILHMSMEWMNEWLLNVLLKSSLFSIIFCS